MDNSVKKESSLNQILYLMRLPIQFFSIGSLGLLILIGAVLFVSVQLVTLIETQLVQFILLVRQEHSLSDDIALRLVTFSKILSWLFVYPALLASQVLPARLLYLHAGLPLFTTIKDSVTALRLAILGLVRAASKAPFYLIPVIAILLLDIVLRSYLIKPEYVYSFYFIFFLIVVGVFVKILPVILTPITAVSGLYEIDYAEAVAHHIYEFNTSILSILFVGLLTFSLVLHLLFGQFTQITQYEYVAQLIFLCYFHFVISAFMVRALVQKEALENQARQELR